MKFGSDALAPQMISWIEELVEDEGNTVMIVSPNPDFNGLPDRIIEVCGDWTNWHPKIFGGKDLFTCLELACEAKRLKGEI